METDEYREEYVTDTVSSALSRVLVSTRKEKDSVRAAESTLYIYGNGLVYEYTGDINLYHHYNNLGSTMMLTGVGGMVVAKYTYGVYGELLSGDTSLTRFLYNGRCGVTTDDNGLYYMRQRYYNPEIKRFVNQDILTGSVDNSQSLNRYSYVQGNPVSYTDPFGLSPMNGLFTGTDYAHCILGLLGCVPGPVGVVANLIDAGIYAFVDHDYLMAAMSGLGAVTLGAGGVAKWAAQSAKYAKLSKSCKYVEMLGGILSNGIEFFTSGADAINMGSAMWQKYVVNGQAFDENTAGEFISLGMSAVSCIFSGVDMSDSGKKLGKMLQEDGVTNKLKQLHQKYALNSGGYSDFYAVRDLFAGKKIDNADIAWSSGMVAGAAKRLEAGVKSVTVKNRSQAEELFLGLYQGDGYVNVTGMDAMDAKNLLGGKGNTYHWDDIFDSDGYLIGHGAGNPDAQMPHLQIHPQKGSVIRIFFEDSGGN